MGKEGGWGSDGGKEKGRRREGEEMRRVKGREKGRGGRREEEGRGRKEGWQLCPHLRLRYFTLSRPAPGMYGWAGVSPLGLFLKFP